MEEKVELVELLVVEDCFDIPQRGVLLTPALPFTDNPLTNQNCDATIVMPDGSLLQGNAEIGLIHLNGGRWRRLVFLKNLSKADVPIGSRLLVPADMAQRLLTRDESEAT
jgi:hypothetical protein